MIQAHRMPEISSPQGRVSSPRGALAAHLLLLLASLYIDSSRALQDNWRNSFCGLTKYDDWVQDARGMLRAQNSSPAASVPRMFRTKLTTSDSDQSPESAPRDFIIPGSSGGRHSHREWIPPPKDSVAWLTERRDKLERLARELVPVRIRLLYDAAFEAEFATQAELQMFVRNMILDAQLIYEQPELYQFVKLNFVLTHLERVRRDWPIHESCDDMLYSLDRLQGNSSGADYDITFVLLFTHMKQPDGGDALLGLASVGSFCNVREPSRSLLLKANTINNAVTLAHELGHSLNVMHDGFVASPPDFNFERFCHQREFIMSPWGNTGKAPIWSSCSADAMRYYLTDDAIFQCLFDPARIGNARPLSPVFDFGPNSPGRSPLPGELLSLDRQCQLGIDRISKSKPKSWYLKQNITSCQMIICQADSYGVQLAPALIGSECWLNETTRGSCSDGACRLS